MNKAQNKKIQSMERQLEAIEEAINRYSEKKGAKIIRSSQDLQEVISQQTALQAELL